MGAAPDVDALLAMSDAAWTRACAQSSRAQRAIERLHDTLVASHAPLAALRTLRVLEDALAAEGYAVDETLTALRQAVSVARPACTKP